jgi:hypothetical protein
VRSEARKAIISATSSGRPRRAVVLAGERDPRAPDDYVQLIPGGGDNRDGVLDLGLVRDVGRNRERLAACSLRPPPPYGPGCCRDRTTLWSQAYDAKRLLSDKAEYMSGKTFAIEGGQGLVNCVDVKRAVGETGEREP